jgi:DNA ligase-1
LHKIQKNKGATLHITTFISQKTHNSKKNPKRPIKMLIIGAKVSFNDKTYTCKDISGNGWISLEDTDGSIKKCRRGAEGLKVLSETNKANKAVEESAKSDGDVNIVKAVEKPKSPVYRMPSLLLAQTFNDEKHNPKGWWCSEKIDGVRAFWSCKTRTLYTRNENVINCPAWFRDILPHDTDLDGELWISHNTFNKVSGIVRRKVPVDEDWIPIKYVIFDLPTDPSPYEERVKKYHKIVKDICKNNPQEHNGVPFKSLACLMPIEVRDTEHVFSLLDINTKKGAEGLMLRKPGSLYENKRSNTLLKVKKFTDEDGTVVDYTEGTGKYVDKVGALILKTKAGKLITVGTGLTDEIRENPPAKGSVVIFKYFEMSAEGIPRFPVYVGERAD